MNEFLLYRQLWELENIAAQYAEGRKLCPMIRSAADQISSQLYRVAVIGEFNRGKSSLINALVGIRILPTDILPMTAAVTRLVYGNQPKIFIHFKDGRVCERTIEELSEFATQYDAEKGKMARSVQEIEVRYPSVFCKNHIEIIDTPGLNDNEFMSSMTLGIIGKVDAAIVVISANKPLSLTEQELIVDLIKQQEIRHLFFVITFIDTLQSEKEKNEIINYISRRLSSEVLEQAVQDDPEIFDKAVGILKDPNIFGVSSKQALDAFISGDKDLLNASRFPKFKEKLYTLLTAAQSADLIPKVKHFVDKAEHGLPDWMGQDAEMLQNRERELKEHIEAVNEYLENGHSELIIFLRQADHELGKCGINGAGIDISRLEDCAKKIFIKELTSLNSAAYSHDHIRAALENGANETKKAIDEAGRSIEDHIKKSMMTVFRKFSALRERMKLSDRDLKKSQEEAAGVFPRFEWIISPIPNHPYLCGVDVMPHICEALHASLLEYSKKIVDYISAWRVIFLKQNKRDQAIAGSLQFWKEELEKVRKKQIVFQENYQKHLDEIAAMQKVIRQETGNRENVL